MTGSEFDIELAEQRVAEERDAALRRIRAELRQEGAVDCVACGEPVPQERRLAAPSARRCAACQARLERYRHQRRAPRG